jgi:hypothetical protein
LTSIQDARRSRIFDAIDGFAGDAPQFDEITILVLRR